ncbi:TetR family transcriptional regulator [Actinosynnema sp. NPDC050436]|uniref:TetR family transcriptional regulator n=1 Tax=Actinosynnema sp. NPDC050436 TaxID=3155659 RepID=UPI0033E2E561
MRLTRSEQQERNRAALIEAARATIAARGAAASLDAIAEAAGLTTGAVYSIFGSRRELFRATVEDQFRDRPEQVARLAATDLDLAGVLRACAAEHPLPADDDLARTELHEMLLVMGDDRLRAQVAAILAADLDRVTGLLTGRVVPGTDPVRRCTPEQARRVATALRAVLTGYGVHALVDRDPRDARAISDTCAALAALAR